MTFFGASVTTVGWPSGISIAEMYKKDAAAYDGKGLGPYCEFFAGSKGDWVDCLQRYQKVGWGKNPNEKVPVLCAKVHTNSSLDEVITYFGERKTPWCAVFMHEIQGFIMNGDITVAKYRKTHEQMATRRKHHLRYGKYMQIVGINAGYWIFKHANQSKKRGIDVLTLFKGMPIDVVSVDHYFRRTPVQGPGYLKTYLAGFDQLAADAKRLGVPWAVTEMGLDTRLGSGRPKFLQDVVVRLRKKGALWALYWEGGGQADYRLRGHPDALAVWKAAIASGKA